MVKHITITVLTVMVFLSLFLAWGNRARSLPLDNDEYYTQMSGVTGITWRDMWSGNIPEGNNSPLFYSLQKLYQRAVGYEPPQAWRNGQWGYQHPKSHTVMRCLSIIYMSLGVALIFCFFTYRLGWIMGFYALGICLTSYMVWMYAVIARPYALWFLFTVLQVVIVSWYVESTNKRRPVLVKALAGINCLLSLTIFLGIISTLGACVVLWMNGLRKKAAYGLLLLLPLCISLFYFWHSPKYSFFIKNGAKDLVMANIPLDRWFIIVLGFCLWMLMQAKGTGSFLNNLFKKLKVAVVTISIFSGIVFAGVIALYYKLYLGQSVQQEGFEVSNRYFMFLTPFGIFLTVWATYIMVKGAKNPQLKKAMIGLLVVLFIFRALRTVSYL